MSRSRRPRRAAPPVTQEPPAATVHDATAVVQITDAGVKAIVATAAEYGLDGAPWDPDVLHKQIMPIVARALRQSTDWWADRRPELATPKEPDVPVE
jgi:hypothetical protein